MLVILIVEVHTYVTTYQIKHYKYVVYFVSYASANLFLKYYTLSTPFSHFFTFNLWGASENKPGFAGKECQRAKGNRSDS